MSCLKWWILRRGKQAKNNVLGFTYSILFLLFNPWFKFTVVCCARAMSKECDRYLFILFFFQSSARFPPFSSQVTRVGIMLARARARAWCVFRNALISSCSWRMESKEMTQMGVESKWSKVLSVSRRVGREYQNPFSSHLFLTLTSLVVHTRVCFC